MSNPRHLARPGVRALAAALVIPLALARCDAGGVPATPPITPGTDSAPREVNIVARDYAYAPAVVDLVPGETVVLHVVNGGLETHEAVVGDLEVQLAWEAAEAATVGHPPGPTPEVRVSPGLEGLRVVVASGQRVDVPWSVPTTGPDASSGWFVGCHIPGHWQKGMVVPVRFVDAGGRPLATVPPLPVSSADG